MMFCSNFMVEVYEKKKGKFFLLNSAKIYLLGEKK